MAVIPDKAVIATANPIHCTWARRNRLTESTPLSWTDPDQTPEAGQTTTIIVYKLDGVTEITRVTGLTGTSHDLPWSAFGGNDSAILKFISERDGYESLSGYAIQVTLPNLTISGTPVLTATKGLAYTGFTAAAHFGTPPYAYSLVGTWPAGIVINSATGAVSGTPTAIGTFAGLSVRVTDAASNTAELANFELDVAAAPASSVTFLAHRIDAAEKTVYTFTDVPLGAPADDRIIVVFVAATDSSGGDDSPQSVAISANGYPLSHINSRSGPRAIALYCGRVPTGAFGNIVVDFNGAGGAQDNCGVAVHELHGLSTLVYQSINPENLSTGPTSPCSGVLDVMADGAVVAGAWVNSSSATTTWTGVDKDLARTTIKGFASLAAASRLYGSSAIGTTVGLTTSVLTSADVISASFQPKSIAEIIGQNTMAYVVATSATATIPPSTSIGDLLLAFVMHRDTLTPPAGWTFVTRATCTGAGATQHLSVYKRRAASGDAGVATTWSQASSQRAAVKLFVLRNIDGPLVDVVVSATNTQNNASSSGAILATAAATAPRQMALAATTSIQATTPQAVSAPPGYTLQTPASLADNRIAVAAAILDAGGSVAGSMTWAGLSSGGYASVSVIIG